MAKSNQVGTGENLYKSASLLATFLSMGEAWKKYDNLRLDFCSVL
jgi:hypothetical protein